MKVEELMTRGVGTCRPYDGADEAARVMWEQDCGTVPVVDQDGRVVAMITDRDICIAALTQGRPIAQIRVSSAMSRNLWSCRPDDDLEQAEKVMRSRQIRRLPVVAADGRLAGILSISDLARAAVSAKASTAKKEAGRGRKRVPGAADVGQTLGAISAPAAPR